MQGGKMRTVDELRDRVRELEQKVEDLEGMLGELPQEGKCAMLLVQHVDGEYVWACEPYDFASYIVVDAEADAYTGKVFSDPFGRSDFGDKLSVAELLRRAAAELDETGDEGGVMDMQERLIEELEAERDEWKAKAEMYRRQLGGLSAAHSRLKKRVRK